MQQKTKKWSFLTAAILLGLGSMTPVQAAVTSVSGDGKTIQVTLDETTGESAVISAITVGSDETLRWNTAALVTGSYLYSYLQKDTLGLAGGDATGSNALAIGEYSEATSEMSIAFGFASKSMGYYSTAIGDNSHAYSNTSVAIGRAAQVGSSSSSGTNDGGVGGIAIGSEVTLINEGGESVFSGSGPSVTANYGIAIGTYTSVSGSRSLALGYGAKVAVQNAVALGPESKATEINTISVGSSSNTRRIVNVANGTKKTDAATYGQLVNSNYDSTLAGYKAYEADSNGIVTVTTNNGGTAFKIKVGTSGSGATYTGSDTISISSNNEISVKNMAMSTVGATDGATASGSYAFAIGGGAQATGANSIALGQGASATFTQTDSGDDMGATIAIGATAAASGNGSVSVGYGAATAGNDALAFGSFAKADGKDSSAIGSNAHAYNTGTLAIGAESIAYGEGAATVGYNAFAGGARSIALGNEAKTGYYVSGTYYGYGTSAVAIGDSSWAVGDYNVAIGYGAAAGLSSDYKTLVVGGTAIGLGAGAFGEGATAIGDGSRVNNQGATAIGLNTYSNGDFSTSIGFTAQALGANSTAIGYQAVVGADKGITTEDGNKVATVSFGHQNGDTYYATNASTGLYEAKTYTDTVLSRLTNVADGKANADAATYGQLVKNKEYTFDANGVATIETNSSTDKSQKVAFTLKLASGTIDSGNSGYVTGGQLYTELRNVTSTNYIAAGKTTAANLSALDQKIGAAKTRNSSIYAANDDIETQIYNVAGKTLVSVTNATAGGSANKTQAATLTMGDGTTKTIEIVGEGAVSQGDMRLVNGNTVNAAIEEAKKTILSDVSYEGSDTVSITKENDKNVIRVKNMAMSTTGANLGATASGAYSFAIGGNSVASGGWAYALGSAAKATGTGSVALGVGAEATWTELSPDSSGTTGGTIAIGQYAKASGNGAAALGAGAEARGEDAVAFGSLANAAGYESVAIGSSANAGGISGTAVGAMSNASATAASAFGYYSQATAEVATALGYGSGAMGTGTTALGAGAKAYQGADYSIAIGVNSEAQAANAVAIGTNSVASEANTVSFGHKSTDKHVTATGEMVPYGSDLFSRLTNVADGTDNHDVATYGQLVKNKEYTFDANGVATIETNSSTDESQKVAFTLKLASGTIDSGNSGYVTGGQLYTELRNVTSTNYIAAGNTTAANLSALDQHVKMNKTNISNLDTKVTNLDSRVTTIENTIDSKIDGKIDGKIGDMKLDGGTYEFTKDNASQAIKYANGGTAFTITIKGLGEGGTGTTYTAGDYITISDDNKISVITDGKVESGNTGIVTGGTVYNAITEKTGDTSKLSAAGLGSNLTDSVLSVNDKISGLSSDINKVGAGAAALAALRPEGFDPNDKWSFAVGYGHYKSANAGALGVFFKPNADTTLSLGGTIGNGDTMMNAGVSFKLGKRGKSAGIYQSSAELIREVNALRADNAAQAKEIANLKADNAKIKADNIKMQQQIEAILSKVEMSDTVTKSVVR